MKKRILSLGLVISMMMSITQHSVKATEDEIVLNATAFEMVVDGVSSTLSNDSQIIWSSLDESIATVDENGVVTGVSNGQTSIVATKNDSEQTCIITVKEPYIKKSAENVTVRIMAQKDNEFILGYKEIEVNINDEQVSLREYDHNNYKIEAPTVLDAIAKASDEEIALEWGMVSSAFGYESTSNIALVNGQSTHDDVYTLGNWGLSHTYYGSDENRIEDGDVINFYFLQDTYYWSDVYTQFENYEESIYIDDSITLTLSGSYDNALEGVQLCAVNEDGTLTEIDGKITDLNGEVTFKFDNAGNYIISANGMIETYDYWTGQTINSPIVSPWCEIEVRDVLSNDEIVEKKTPLVYPPQSIEMPEWLDWSENQQGEILELLIDGDFRQISQEGEYLSSGNYEFRILNNSFDVISSGGIIKISDPTYFWFSGYQNLEQTIDIRYVEISSNDDFIAGEDFTISINDYIGMTENNTYKFIISKGMYDDLKVVLSEDKKLDGYNDTLFVSHVLDNCLYANQISNLETYQKIQIICDKKSDLEYDVFIIDEDAKLSIATTDGSLYIPFKEELKTQEVLNDDGTKTITYDLEDGTYYYTLSKSGNMTYANEIKKENGQNLEIDLTHKLTSSEDVIIRPDGNNESSILLNINKSHQLDLDINQTHKILAIRTSQAYYNSNVYAYFEPKFHYEITNIEGNPITITDDGVITANSQGIAIVTVTYDAINAFDHEYSAIYPENTGVFIVRVGTNENVEIGIDLDAEHDTLYFSDNIGYKLTFTPENDSEILVNNAIIGEKSAIYGDFDGDVEKNEDGSVTVLLKEGRNIISATKDGVTSYQIVNAKPIVVNISGEDGREINSDNKALKGETISINITGIVEPAPKLFRLYNFTSGVSFKDASGNLYGRGNNTNAGTGSYDFLTNGGKFTITVPTDYNLGNIELTNGKIGVNAYGSTLGTHRTIDTENGLANSYTNPISEFYSILPDIQFEVAYENEEIPVDEIILDQTEIELYKRGTQTLVATVYPFNATNKVVLWESENEQIATVDTNGKVTGVTQGTTTIKASVDGKTAECIVTVISTPSTDTGSTKEYITISIDTLEADNNYILAPLKVELQTNDTAWDVAKRVMDSYEIDYEVVETASLYITSIAGYEEMDERYGSKSGWMYSVNDEFPEMSIADYVLNSNDVLEIRYTTTLGEDIESENSGSSGSSGNSGTTSNNDVQDSQQDDSEVETYEKIIEKFTDISEDLWYNDAVCFVVLNGIFNGTSETEFSPNLNMTRAMVFTVLHRISGDEEFTGSEIWYQDGLNWALENGISDGTNIDANITREQLATMLYRAENSPSANSDLSIYEDFSEISSYAIEALKWANEQGLITGKTKTNLAPKDMATRAEVATIIMRYMNNQEV